MLRITTNSEYSDIKQLEAAGYLEGTLTARATQPTAGMLMIDTSGSAVGDLQGILE